MRKRCEIEEAAQLYADFHGEEADEIEREELPEVAFIVGEVDAISYTIIEDGKEVSYHHEFDEPPSLAVSHDGQIAFILAGGWKFTERGFVG